MTIQAGTEADIPEILSLYQLALGNAEGLRTESYWRWKHMENPFGASPLLLAREDGRLVGMRAFLRWRFRYQEKIFQAYRPVDTATHPEYQGKGIFSKLTKTLIDQLQAGEPSIIYNTPNAQSKPGYLKMGWKEFGKTRLRVKISPLHILQNAVGLKGQGVGNLDWDEDALAEVLSSWMNGHRDQVITDYSIEYLNWRFKKVPVFAYQTKMKKEGSSTVVIIFRLKKVGSFQELRITEIFYAGTSPRLIKSTINELNEAFRPDVITLLTDASGMISNCLPSGFFKADSFGLNITYRKLNDDSLVNLAAMPNQWYFSAGTLELF